MKYIKSLLRLNITKKVKFDSLFKLNMIKLVKQSINKFQAHPACSFDHTDTHILLFCKVLKIKTEISFLNLKSCTVSYFFSFSVYFNHEGRCVRG